MKVLILSDDGFEDLELMVPYYRFKEEGFQVDIASKKRGKIEGKHDYKLEANKSYEEINPDDYDMLFLPGGKAPAKVRKSDEALSIAKHFIEKEKPVAAICHGPQILISAGVVRNRHMTCWPEVAKELKEAGAIYEDKDVIVDGNLVTSRMPDDLPAFTTEVLKKAKAGAAV
ncbi:MAG: type 1 glutamine amidotransferase [Nitrospiraceae bacterium]|nr:type 1 glutamine amidotransferase [Nitrospiraceae bacterium]